MLIRFPVLMCVVALAAFLSSELALSQQSLELDLEKFPQSTQAPTEDLQLDLEQFDESGQKQGQEQELELNLEQFDGNEKPAADDKRLNLEQFDNSSQPGAQVNTQSGGNEIVVPESGQAPTRIDRPGIAHDAGFEISGFAIFLIVSALFLLIYLWRKRG